MNSKDRSFKRKIRNVLMLIDYLDDSDGAGIKLFAFTLGFF